jgi:hypothetical protein
VVSTLTGIPFWGAVVLIIVLGIVGYAVVNYF